MRIRGTLTDGRTGDRLKDLQLYFVRHGESVANAFDRAGETRPEERDKLSERGLGAGARGWAAGSRASASS